MKIKLINVGSVKQGEITLEQGRFNIKYAANGTGKSTFAKFLKAIIESDEETIARFVPLGTEEVPSMAFDGVQPASCMLFDEDYISSYLFQPEDVLNNTIRLIKLNSEVSQSLIAFNDSLIDLKTAIDSLAINEFLSKIEPAVTIGKRNTDGTLNGSCKLAKATKTGANVLHSNEQTSPFKDNIESTDSPTWYKWRSDGDKYARSRCPYCGQELPDDFENLKNALKALFGKTDFKNNVEVRQHLLSASAYLSNHSGIDGLLATTTKPADPEYAAAMAELNILSNIKSQILAAKQLDPFDLRRMDSAGLVSKICALVIDPSLIANENFVNAVGKYNAQLQSLINAADSLQKAVQTCDKAISRAVSRFKDFVNDYLKQCGIPYEFTIEQKDSEHAKAKLVKRKDNKEFDVPSETLSYGERNCLCLALFAIDVCQNNPDIVILDDPISSFDHGKRFAMFYLIFSNKDFNFKNRTVALLTHDITPLIDFVKRKAVASMMR